MKAARLGYASQKRMIMDFLAEQPMTVDTLARRMLCSADTVRKRLRELQAETGTVRVVGWDVRGPSLVRLWGVGARKRAALPAPLPEVRKKARARQQAAGHAASCSRAGAMRGEKREKPVPFRLEPFDLWLFSVRRPS